MARRDRKAFSNNATFDSRFVSIVVFVRSILGFILSVQGMYRDGTPCSSKAYDNYAVYFVCLVLFGLLTYACTCRSQRIPMKAGRRSLALAMCDRFFFIG